MIPKRVANVRNIQDALLVKSKALPAAAAANYTDSIDLGQTIGGTLEFVNVVVQVEATTTLIDAKTITLTLKDSADNSSFTAISGVAAPVITGTAATNGSDAYELRLRLPTATRRYIRLDAAVATAGGDNTAKSYQLSVLV